MKTRKALGLAMTALLATLLLGSAGIAVAAPAEDAPVAERTGFAVRIGDALRDAGTRAIDIVADLTGLQLHSALNLRPGGESIATIAESEGIGTENLVAEMLDARTTVLNEKVADGSITQEHADDMLVNMEDRVSERVSSTELGTPGGRGQGSGQGMGNGAGEGLGAGEGRGMGGNGGECTLDAE